MALLEAVYFGFLSRQPWESTSEDVDYLDSAETPVFL